MGLQTVMVIVGIVGWMSFAALAQTNGIIKEGAHQAASSNNSLIETINTLRVNYLESADERKRITIAYKETLDQVSWDKNSEVSELLRHNTDLMAKNLGLSDQMMELENAMIQNKSNTRKDDAVTIARLKNDKLKLQAQTQWLEKEMGLMYTAFREKVDEFMASEEIIESVEGFETIHLSAVPSQFNPQPKSPETHESPGYLNEPRVISVNHDQAFVIINLGTKNGLKKGQFLIAKKDSQDIARLHVIETRDALSACNIEYLSDDTLIDINDPVHASSS